MRKKLKKGETRGREKKVAKHLRTKEELREERVKEKKQKKRSNWSDQVERGLQNQSSVFVICFVRYNEDFSNGNLIKSGLMPIGIVQNRCMKTVLKKIKCMICPMCKTIRSTDFLTNVWLKNIYICSSSV